MTTPPPRPPPSLALLWWRLIERTLTTTFRSIRRGRDAFWYIRLAAMIPGTSSVPWYWYDVSYACTQISLPVSSSERSRCSRVFESLMVSCTAVLLIPGTNHRLPSSICHTHEVQQYSRHSTNSRTASSTSYWYVVS